MWNKKGLFLAFVVWGVYCCGQSKKNDSTAIVSYVDKIILKVNVDTEYDAFLIESNGTRVDLLTNNRYRLFLSLDYDFIGASVGITPQFLPDNSDDDLKGTSSFSEYNFRFFLGKYVQQLQYKQITGFYVQNTGDFIDGWIRGQDEYLQFPDLKTTLWGGATSYVLNPEFSYRNLIYNTEWQRKSAGSLVPTLRYSHSRISYSQENIEFFENIFDVIIEPAYFYTFVFHKNWFVAPSAQPSVGVRYATAGNSLNTDRENNTLIPFTLNTGLQMGYGSEKIIFGVDFDYSDTWFSEDANTQIQDNVFTAKIYFGYRLDAPKFVEDTFDWFYKTTGLE